jgi:Spy/CpxP family protein refolding chaperone
MKTILTLALTCCALAVPALPGEARTSQQSQADGSRSAPRPPSSWWKSEEIKQELRLTAEQSAEIERIVQGSMAQLKGDKDDLDRAHSDFRLLMEQPTASERELLKAAERLEMARFSMARERTRMLVRIHSALTPEQRRGLDVISKRREMERSRSR